MYVLSHCAFSDQIKKLVKFIKQSVSRMFGKPKKSLVLIFLLS